MPHPWNLAPSGAVALYSGARLRSWQAYALPLAVYLATNAVKAMYLGKQFFFFPLMPVILGCFALNVLLGRVLTKTESPMRIGLAGLAGSLQFFVITNFAQWLIMGVDPSVAQNLLPGTYPRSWAGLVDCFAQAVPFYRDGTLLGDLLYTTVLFGAHALLTRKVFTTEQVMAARSPD